MPRYSEERKAAVLKKLLPPESRSVASVATEEGIANATLYGWLKACRQQGVPVPGKRKTGDEWTADAKLAVVIETAPLSATELGAYCREKGLYPEQVQRWKEACLQGAGQQEAQEKAARQQRKKDRQTIKTLQSELQKKEHVLAETTSLLVLSKKLEALYGSPGQRGRLTSLNERTRLLKDFDEAVASGAARYKAAELMGLSQRTLKRWRYASGQVAPDRRPQAERVTQPHQLTQAEETVMLTLCSEPEYQSLPPSQIVPRLADQGRYLASESSFYRVLKKHRQLNHRGRMAPVRQVTQPTSFTASEPNQVWSWDISYCPSAVRGEHWYLYLILDVYSRKIIAWEVHDNESGELAKRLMERALLRERCWHTPPILHSDNGAPMTSYTLRARLAELGMLMSHSRPRVSNDNPYSEALFRTVKYCPAWPTKGFTSLGAVRQWMLTFEHAYNERHLHSGINFVTPADRHQGKDKQRLLDRRAVYERAKRQNPGRWSGDIRCWEATGSVSLNPGRPQEIEGNKEAA
ncbi:IS3 family transposase [Halomonas piscis]|uniref:IS3 family transposase n=1 Tax=Halomonas piscis TaxID=3031727 RepID=A0ABY9YWU3_9GAMM|nr:IS3 family transposase [Halomonas piscis]WNK19077.1 IS3 family transposase [Halomonas piscis]